jgi:hypothetical protein
MCLQQETLQILRKLNLWRLQIHNDPKRLCHLYDHLDKEIN